MTTAVMVQILLFLAYVGIVVLMVRNFERLQIPFLNRLLLPTFEQEESVSEGSEQDASCCWKECPETGAFFFENKSTGLRIAASRINGILKIIMHSPKSIPTEIGRIARIWFSTSLDGLPVHRMASSTEDSWVVDFSLRHSPVDITLWSKAKAQGFIFVEIPHQADVHDEDKRLFEIVPLEGFNLRIH